MATQVTKNNTNSKQDEKTSSYAAEFNLADFFQMIWDTRKLVAIISFLTVLALVGLASFSKLAIPTTHNFQFAVRFVFPEVEKGLYPNNSQFSQRDLLSPVVLRKVYAKNELEKFGIDKSEFFSNLSVFPYAPTYNAIINRFNAKLDNKKLSFVERELIEKNMTEELNKATFSNAIVQLSFSERFGVSKNMAQKLLGDIIEEWERHSIEEKGVLKAPNVAVVRVPFEVSNLGDFDPLLIAELINNEVVVQKRNLRGMLEIAGVSTIRDQKSGLSVLGVLDKLERFQQYDLSHLTADLIVGNAEKNNVVLVETLKVKQQYFVRIQEENERISKAIKESYDLYRDRREIDSANQVSTPMVGLVNQKSRQLTTPQISDGFVDRLIQFVERERTGDEADVALRQNFADKYLESKNAATAANQSVLRVGALIERLEVYAKLGAISVAPEIKNVSARIDRAISMTNDFRQITGRLFDQIEEDAISGQGKLYVALELPANRKQSIYHPLFNSNFVFVIILAAIAAAIFAVFADLARRFIKI